MFSSFLSSLVFSAEFDALNGSRISSINVGAPIVRMAYSPTSGHSVIAVLEVSPVWRLLIFDNYSVSIFKCYLYCSIGYLSAGLRGGRMFDSVEGTKSFKNASSSCL